MKTQTTILLLFFVLLIPICTKAQPPLKTLDNFNKKKEQFVDDFLKKSENLPNTARLPEVKFTKQGKKKFKKEKYEEALNAFNRALEHNPTYIPALQNKGIVRAKLGNHKGAIADFSRILESDASNALAFYHRGASQFELRQYAKALDDYDEAMKLDMKKVLKIKGYTPYRKKAITYLRNDTSQIKGMQLFWIIPDIDKNKKRTLYVDKNRLPIKLKIISEQTLQSTDFTIYINGKKSNGKMDEGQLFGSDQVYTFEKEVLLQSGENILEVGAKKYRSAPLTIQYNTEKPNLYVLSVGTRPQDLRFTVEDARGFGSLFWGQDSKGPQTLFKKSYIRHLVDNEAEASKIIEELEQFKVKYDTQNLSPNDVIILFFSSHGFMKNGKFYLQGQGYRKGKERSKAVNFQDIKEILAEVPCKKIVFLDACQSGGAKADVNAIQDAIRRLNNQADGMTTIVSSSENELSYEDEKWRNGAFTEAIIQGLRGGKADADGNKIITVYELFNYIKQAVPKMVEEVKGKKQTPQITNDELGDVGIFVIKK